MESANLHHLQDQLVLGSSPSPTPSCYGLGTTHAWTPNTILNHGNFNANINGALVNSRDQKQQNDILVDSSMIQDLGFHWATTTAHDLQLARIKQELSDSYPKLFTGMLNNNSQSSSSTVEDLQLYPSSYIKNEQRDLIDLNEKLLLRNFSSGCQINGLQLPAGELIYSNAQNCSSSGSIGVAAPSRSGTFSQIFPTINISNLNQSSSEISSSLGMNLEGLDIFNSARFSGRFSQPSLDHLELFKDSSLCYGLDHTQQLNHRPSSSPRKISAFSPGVTEAKRPNNFLEPKAPQAAPKKSRLESRASCPPFKVRKEKLGDRIAALQQLVAPFGKTDTASVLMEAIGYIKFLQNQVETLSVPYMKSSRNKTSRTMQGGSTEDGHEERKRDLRTRGLCLVPLSCLSYVTDGGGAVWPPPTFS